MAAVHGKDTVVYVNGYELTTYLNEVSVSREVDTAETSTFGNSAKTYIAGQKDGTADMSGIWDGTAGAVDDRLAAYFGADGTVFTVGYGGSTLGNRADVFAGIQTSYEIGASLGDAVSVSASVQGSGGVWAGKFLHANSTESTTANFTAVNNGAASSNGWVANLHNFAKTGTPAAVVKLQESSDNGAGDAFADIATFATITGVTAEQKSATGAVEQYVRAALTSLAGSASITFVVAFARK